MNLARHIEERAGFPGQVGSEEYACVQLVDDEVLKRWGNKPGFVPAKIRRANHAIARERCGQLAGKRIAFRSFTAVTHDKKLVAVAILYSGKESAPMPLFVRGEQVSFVRHGPIHAGVNCVGMRRPNSEGRAAFDQVRTHGRLFVNPLQ